MLSLGKKGCDSRIKSGRVDGPGQWPSQAKDIPWEALSLIYAALRVCHRLLGLFKERGSHMEIAQKTDVVFPSNFPDIRQGHTFVNSNTVCATSCHLTDDSNTLPSSPEAGSFTGSMDHLPH